MQRSYSSRFSFLGIVIVLSAATLISLPNLTHAQNLYVANNGSTTVSRVGSGGGAATTFATGFSNPTGIAFDAGGSLYAANYNIGTVSRVGPGGGAATTFATGFTTPDGLAFDRGTAPTSAPAPGTLALLALGILPITGTLTRRRRDATSQSGGFRGAMRRSLDCLTTGIVALAGIA